MTQEEKDWIEAANAAIQLKVKKLETVSSELNRLLDQFEERGGWQHCVDDDGASFSSMSDYLSRGLGINPALIEA